MDQAPDLKPPRRDHWYRLSLVVMSIGAASLIAAAILLVLTLTGTFKKGYSGPGTSVAFGDVSRFLTPQPTPTAPMPTPDLAPIADLVIPRFDIDAPVVVKGVDANNVMEVPDGPTDVAWYKFTSPPGAGSNAVFAGHVDYINYGPAVFAHVKDLEHGDAVEVHLEDGTVYKYAVDSSESVPADPSQEVLASIVGPAPQDIVTLITCGGTWDSSAHQYDHRVIVRAVRVLDTGAASASAPTQ